MEIEVEKVGAVFVPVKVTLTFATADELEIFYAIFDTANICETIRTFSSIDPIVIRAVLNAVRNPANSTELLNRFSNVLRAKYSENQED